MNPVNKKLILNINKTKNKEEIFEKIANVLVENEFAKKTDEIVKGLKKREIQITTGLGDGIAIPHTSVENMDEAKIVVIRLKNSLDWKALDNKKVDLIISIVVPKKQSENHFEILTKLSASLIDKEVIKNIKTLTPAKLEKYLNNLVTTNDNQEANQKGALNIVGVTTCVTGVAHTFMAAKALEEEGKKRNWNVRIEKQGQMTKDKLTKEEIANADYVIIAKSKTIDSPERFDGKLVYETEVAEPITKAKKVYDDMLKYAKTQEKNSSSKQQENNSSKKTGILSHLMAGISFMIPYIAMAGIVLGLTTAFGFKYVEGVGSEDGSFLPKNDFAAAINALAGVAFTLYIPILGMFIANSIAGRKAMAPAAILSLLLNSGLSETKIASGVLKGFSPFFNYETLSFSGFDQAPSLGFLGAVAAGYLIGYGINFFTKATDKVNSQAFQTILPLLIIPILFTVIPWLFMAFFGYLPLYYLAIGMSELVSILIDYNLLWIAGGIMGAMICFDLGGPVNKIAMTIGVYFIGTGINGIAALAVSIPAMVLFFSWILHKFTPLKMDEEDVAAAASASLMGFFGITEGAIPFAAKNAKLWMPTFMSAGFVGGILMSFTGVVDNVAMWGGPIIYIAGGFGSTANDLTVQSEWLKTLWYFLPLIIAGLTGFVVASVLSLIYQKQDIHIASYEMQNIKTKNKEKISNLKQEIKNAKKLLKEGSITQAEYQNLLKEKKLEIEKIRNSQKEKFSDFNKINNDFQKELKKIKPGAKVEYKKINTELKNELKNLKIEKNKIKKEINYMKKNKEDNESELSKKMQLISNEIYDKEIEIEKNYNYYFNYGFKEKIENHFQINT